MCNKSKFISLNVILLDNKSPYFDVDPEILSSKDCFPAVSSTKTEQIQTIKVTDEDTIEYVTHKYEYKEVDGKKYLVSTTYDSENLITCFLKDELTPKGLKYHSSKTYIYNENDNIKEYLVNGKRKSTFPFKSIKKLKGWSSKTVYSYDNKVMVKSKVSYIGTEEIEFNNRKVLALKFHREAKAIYKKDYKKEVLEYEYVWYFLKGLGMYKFVRKGNIPFKGEVVKSE